MRDPETFRAIFFRVAWKTGFFARGEQCPPVENEDAKRAALMPQLHFTGRWLSQPFYHLVTGRPPFQADSLEGILQQVFQQEPISPRLLNPSVPRDLETICLKCLEKEPQRRYQSAHEVAEELDRVLKNEPIHARPIGTAGKAWRWCRGKPVVASLSAAIGLLLLALAIGGPLVAARQRALAERYRMSPTAPNSTRLAGLGSGQRGPIHGIARAPSARARSIRPARVHLAAALEPLPAGARHAPRDQSGARAPVRRVVRRPAVRPLRPGGVGRNLGCGLAPVGTGDSHRRCLRRWRGLFT
jgi:hypothetical protein